MILLELLGVVVQQLLDVGLDEPDLGKDLVGRGGPDEWFCVAVPVGNVVANPLDENLDRTERAAANRLAGDDAEPGFDLVEPGRPDRGNSTFGFFSSHPFTSGVVWVERLSSTT